jgi:uncharacterized protein DUF3857
MKYFFLALWCMAVTETLVAQKSPVKFGKIDSELVKMTSHPLDADADAVVLVDYGNTSFRYDDREGFMFDFTRTIRVKILTKDGLDQGNFEISYYHSISDHEMVSSLNGYSYNIVDGKVEKSKLEKSSVFKEELNDNWDQMKISMPDVKIGTVVELTYKITSPFIWNLQTWVFQSDMPTVRSEYRAAIPEYFDYQLLFSGYHPLVISENKSIPASITTQSVSRTDGKTRTVNFDTQKIDFYNLTYRWVAKDIPTFKIEPYVASPSDYVTKIKFELRGTKYPNSLYKRYMGTWQSLNKSFLENSSFGGAIKSGALKEEIESVASLGSDDAKIVGWVNLVRREMAWNGKNTRYVTSSLRKAWADKKGGTAEINLAIVAGLRKLGFKSDPVIISTRGHGMVRSQYAISTQFNSVIACVEMGDQVILLDGTDRYLPVGVLPQIDLNGKGWRVSKISPGWIELKPKLKEEKKLVASFKIQSTGIVEGTMELTQKGYASYKAHKEFKMMGEKEYVKTIRDKNEGWSVQEFEHDGESSNKDTFTSKYVLSMNESLTIAGDRIYFNPTLDEIMDENPFKLEKREYPVDYGIPIRREYKFKYSFPEGFEIEEVPEQITLILPNAAGSFHYKITKDEPGTILFVADFSVNKTMFAQTEYHKLKQFYEQVVQKCAEQVVVKKTGQP